MKPRSSPDRRHERLAAEHRRLCKRFSGLAAKFEKALRLRDSIQRELASREEELRHIFKLNASLIS
ncbi:MAG TPA: hypothetical protein PK562_05170, partial [Candidatus Omnitrophota bacterium]|nr:hypothetical protein [Candidatus Omnitrophota bacterium]